MSIEDLVATLLQALDAENRRAVREEVSALLRPDLLRGGAVAQREAIASALRCPCAECGGFARLGFSPEAPGPCAAHAAMRNPPPARRPSRLLRRRPA